MNSRITIENLMNKPWWKNANAVKAYIALCFNANDGDARFDGIDIRTGQLVTSIRDMAEMCELTFQQMRTVLEQLTAAGDIKTETKKRLTIVTIEHPFVIESNTNSNTTFNTTCNTSKQADNTLPDNDLQPDDFEEQHNLQHTEQHNQQHSMCRFGGRGLTNRLNRERNLVSNKIQEDNIYNLSLYNLSPFSEKNPVEKPIEKPFDFADTINEICEAHPKQTKPVLCQASVVAQIRNLVVTGKAQSREEAAAFLLERTKRFAEIIGNADTKYMLEASNWFNSGCYLENEKIWQDYAKEHKPANTYTTGSYAPTERGYRK